MRIRQLTLLGFYLNGAAGSGKYENLDIETIKHRINDGSILEFLKEQLGRDVDLSALTEADRAELIDRWQNYVNVIDEHRTLCVDRGGLNLLVAYVLQGVQELTPK